MQPNHSRRIILTQHQEKMLKITTKIAPVYEATPTARTPFAPPQKRAHHVATDLATEARSFENICTPVRCTRKRDFRFFTEDEIPATIRYEAIHTPTTIHVETSHIIVSPLLTTSPARITPTTSPNPSPCPSPRTPSFHPHQRKRVHPTIDIEAARAHSLERICTPVRYSRKSGNRFSGEVEIVAAVSKLPLKRAHGMVTRSMAKRLPVVFLSLP